MICFGGKLSSSINNKYNLSATRSALQWENFKLTGGHLCHLMHRKHTAIYNIFLIEVAFWLFHDCSSFSCTGWTQSETPQDCTTCVSDCVLVSVIKKNEALSLHRNSSHTSCSGIHEKCTVRVTHWKIQFPWCYNVEVCSFFSLSVAIRCQNQFHNDASKYFAYRPDAKCQTCLCHWW